MFNNFETLVSLKEADTFADIFQETCQSCGKEVVKDWRKKTSHVLLSVGVAYCMCVVSAVIKKTEVELPGLASLFKASKIFAVGTSATAGPIGAIGPATPTSGTNVITAGPTGPSGDVVAGSQTYQAWDVQFPSHEKGTADGVNGPIAPRSFFENTVNRNGGERTKPDLKITPRFYEVGSGATARLFGVV